MFPLPVSFKGLLLLMTMEAGGVPTGGLADRQNTATQKRGFYHTKGRDGRKEERIGKPRRVRKDGWKCGGWREASRKVVVVGEIKAELYSLMWLLCSSQLLLQGLLHLHFSLKIAPVIIYLAGARHPALCSRESLLPCLSLCEIPPFSIFALIIS